MNSCQLSYTALNLVLRVSEFNKPVDADITGIVSGNNSITLPPEVLGDEVTEEPGNDKV